MYYHPVVRSCKSRSPRIEGWHVLFILSSCRTVPDFLFGFRHDGAGEAEIFVATLRNGKVINLGRLMQNATAAHYTPAGGGRVPLFVRNDNLYSQRLNLNERKLAGDPGNGPARCNLRPPE